MNIIAFVEPLILFSCGVILLLAGVAVIKGTKKLEMSLRVVAAFGAGLAGAGFIAFSLTGETIRWPSLCLAVSATVWVIRQMRTHQPVNHSLRRSSDWAILDD